MRIIIQRRPSGKFWQVSLATDNQTLDLGLLDAEEMQQLANELSAEASLLLHESKLASLFSISTYQKSP